jgi:hypothetical protein
MTIVKLLFNALLAWALGFAFIAATLYFANDGPDSDRGSSFGAHRADV